MKLLFCLQCQDVIDLHLDKETTCKCGSVSGQYTDNLNATYQGENAIPIGFSNSSLAQAINEFRKTGKGIDFTAFVISKNCKTFKKI